MKLFLKNLLHPSGARHCGCPCPGVFTGNSPVSSQPGWLGLGILLLVLGAAIYLWMVWDFAVFGRGIPLPLDAPIRQVVRGLHYWVHNPMYLGMLLVIIGWPSRYLV